MRSSLALVPVLACLAACDRPRAHVPRSALEPVVARDMEAVPAGSVPAGLVERLGGARLILLGESHYVQEHQEFLVALLPHLHAAGVRHLLQEDMHATAWTGEEYVMARSDLIPPVMDRFDRTLLAGLRAFNDGLPPADRIHYGGFDMNHWVGIFAEYAGEFQRRFGKVAALDPVLAAPPDSAAYQAALDALPAALAADAEALSAALGADPYALLLELVEVEAQSLRLRKLGTAGHLPREELIRARVLEVLRRAGGSPVAVNCGGFHAQKQQVFGPDFEATGSWLARHPELYGGDAGRLRTFAFLGARGWRKSSFDGPPWWLDVVGQAGPDDLIRILAEQAGPRLAFLPLDSPVFVSGAVELRWDGQAGSGPIGAAFDGIVLYPDVSLLASLSRSGG